MNTPIVDKSYLIGLPFSMWEVDLEEVKILRDSNLGRVRDSNSGRVSVWDTMGLDSDRVRDSDIGWVKVWDIMRVEIGIEGYRNSGKEHL